MKSYIENIIYEDSKNAKIIKIFQPEVLLTQIIQKCQGSIEFFSLGAVANFGPPYTGCCWRILLSEKNLLYLSIVISS